MAIKPEKTHASNLEVFTQCSSLKQTINSAFNTKEKEKQRRMKLKFISQHLTRIIIVLVVLNTKLIVSQIHHAPITAQHLQQHHSYHGDFYKHHQTEEGNLQKDEEAASPQHNSYSERKTSNDHYSSHHHHHGQFHFNHLHLRELAESAKDPKNLRNGIYHDGAITFDLGLPNYEILNPHDPPEIITPDHPHYEEQLNHIKKTNNFTIEDFGVTPMPDTETISETTFFESDTTTDSTTITTTDIPETTATTKRFSSNQTKAATTKTTTPSPMKKFKNIKSDIEKHLSKTKEKLRILNMYELDLKNIKSKISSTPSANNVTEFKFVIRKNIKQRPAPFRVSHTNSFNYFKQQNQKDFSDKTSAKIPVPPLETDSKIMKSFYGQSVLLPANRLHNPSYTYGVGNVLTSTPYHRHFTYSNNYLPSPNQGNYGALHNNDGLYHWLSSTERTLTATKELIK
ncbi:hypothetical protein CVS40_9245 [Lucilia cuprina]|nr:hypothetical protein CVS40_9245 [Lucilia cuprina]